MKRYSFFLTLAAMLVLSFGLANGQANGSMYISNLQGLLLGDTLETGQPIVWTISLNNEAAEQISACNNGFRVYSLDGATWNPIVMDTVGSEYTDAMNNLFPIYTAPTNAGSGVDGDTVGIGAFDTRNPAIGFPVGYDQAVVTIRTVISDASSGKHICIDESGYSVNSLWLWGLPSGGAANVIWGPLPNGYGGPVCYALFDVPNNAPDVTNCGGTPDFDHCVLATYQFVAADSDSLGARPLTFVQNSGPGTTSPSGAWSYAPSLADVGAGLQLDIQAQDDPGNLGANCIANLNFTNVAPSFTAGCDLLIPVGKGNSVQIDFDAVSNDCDPISFSLNDVDPQPVGSFSIDPNTGVLTFDTDDADGGITYRWLVCVSDGRDEVCCTTEIEVLLTEPYEVQIEKTHNTTQGGHELVCVSVNKGSEAMTGFDFLISYDASALSFQTALPGDLYSECGWEYFNYRFGPNGNCSNACPSGVLRVVGFAETNNGANHPTCNLLDLPFDLFCLDFLVSADFTLECNYVPIRFWWLDCGDNTISYNPSDDITGFVQALAISRDVWDFDLIGNIANPNVGYPTFQGAQDSDCFPADADPEKPAPLRFIDFINGGIDIVCIDSIDDRGDINLNGISNEVADAVLFTNYFIYGLSVFTINVAGQIAATDVNVDGLALSVADLVYLIRIVIGDAQPFPKLAPVEGVYTVDVKGTLGVDIEVGAVALQLQGNVEPTLLAENMKMEYSFDIANSVTRVLVYSDEKGQSFTGDFINTRGSEVVSIEMATYDGAPIVAKEVELPTVFALNQNYPNPFNPATNISFDLPTAGNYTLSIYNVAGQKVADFAGNAEAGIVTVEWKATDQASGVYFYRVVAETSDGLFKDTKKMVLLK